MIDAVEEAGRNASVNFKPIERFDAEGAAERTARNVRRGGRAEAFPDLMTIHERMAELIQVFNRAVPDEGPDGKIREQLNKVENQRTDVLGLPLLQQSCRYVVLMEVAAEFYWRGQTLALYIKT